MALFYRVMATRSFTLQEHGLSTIFCTCDLDLDLITFTYEPDPYYLKIYQQTSTFCDKAFKSYRLTDRKTRSKPYTMPLCGWSNISIINKFLEINYMKPVQCGI